MPTCPKHQIEAKSRPDKNGNPYFFCPARDPDGRGGFCEAKWGEHGNMFKGPAKPKAEEKTETAQGEKPPDEPEPERDTKAKSIAILSCLKSAADFLKDKEKKDQIDVANTAIYWFYTVAVPVIEGRKPQIEEPF